MNLLWFVPLTLVLVLETLSLLSSRDKFQPATYWIRRLFVLRDKTHPLYWIGVGLWVVLGFHFFVARG